MIYNLYHTISGKTVRQHERFYKRYKKHNKFVLGTLVRTNRGYFIDGCNVDLAAVALWNQCNSDEKFAKPYYDMWQAELKRLEEAKKANEEA